MQVRILKPNIFKTYPNFGLFIVRLGVGFSFVIYHGFPKIVGGEKEWQQLAAPLMNGIGISFLHTFWGFIAAFSEFFGGLSLIFGIFFRPMAFLLSLTMAGAVLHHMVVLNQEYAYAAHAAELFFIFLAFTFIGPGKYSFDAYAKGTFQ